jgi:hypothetical protein
MNVYGRTATLDPEGNSGLIPTHHVRFLHEATGRRRDTIPRLDRKSAVGILGVGSVNSAQGQVGG